MARSKFEWAAGTGATGSQSADAMYGDRGTGQFHPSAATLILFVLVELVAYGSLRYLTRNNHGG